MSVSISQVFFEHHREAIGIHEPLPRISWRFEGTAVDWEQSAYDLQIVRGSDGPVNTHRVNSVESQLVPWPENPLGPAEYATVRARAHGQPGQCSTPWSDWVQVETGLLGDANWSGAIPIAADWAFDHNEAKRPIYFRKSFNIQLKEIHSARLYITALGLYEAQINGQRVGDHVMAPGWQSYSHRHVYNTFDVTELLSKGENALGVIVGEGWYSGRIFSFDPNRVRNHYGDTIGLISLLTVTFKDGTSIKVPTDLSWKANIGPILDSQIYDGEIYDSRLETDIQGWSTPSFNSSSWFSTTELPAIKGKLMAPDGPPVRKIEERKPQRIWTSPGGKTIVDFGQNLVGWVRVNTTGPSGTTITISHAEVLEDGELAVSALRTAKARDMFILNGQPRQILEPHFTFHGFRFIQIDGWPDNEPLTETSVTAVVVHSDMEQTGWFECSDPLLNQFHQNVRWSMKGNFLSVPTDCPQRDERVGWTGDAMVFGATANFLYDCSGFWRSWHRDVWSVMQRNGTMQVPYYVPVTAPDREVEGNWPPASTAVWGDVAVSGPWQIWQAYGDVDMLAEQYSQSKAWIDTGVDRDETGLWNKSGYQRGDWLDPLSPESDAGTAATARHLVADAYLVGMTDLLADISLRLREEDQAKRYRSDAELLRQAFGRAWLKDGKMANRTQTAYALGLFFDLFTNEDDRKKAAQNLREIISENKYLVGTGFAGTWLLGHALRKIGAVEDFYKMLLQTKVPSWLYQVVQNGTTTWERWDSLLPNGTVNGSGMTSFNHYAFGSVADWIHRTIGGLEPATPGWKSVLVAPVPGGGITSATTTFLGGYGTVKSQWWIESHKEENAQARNGFHLNVWIPPNSKAHVKMPNNGETFDVGSGFYKFHDPSYMV
ncbi:alfa-L-rhamnosidase [Ilyonectria destructans]|nr:alfa-L-rhamnosidase [Ilyonectria destructans]